MTEVAAVSLEALVERIEALEQEHGEFRKVHVSRRGVEGGRGETGPAGPVGPPADVNQAAEIQPTSSKRRGDMKRKFRNSRA